MNNSDIDPPENNSFTVAKLIQELRIGDSSSRRRAVRKLVGYGSLAVPLLVEALQDKYWPVRYHAACALGKIKEPTAIPDLISVWKDSHEIYWKVRERAGKALVEIGSTAVPALIALMQEKGHGVRRHAASALGDIGDPSAVLALTAALHDEDKVLRYRAREAIEKIKST